MSRVTKGPLILLSNARHLVKLRDLFGNKSRFLAYAPIRITNSGVSRISQRGGRRGGKPSYTCYDLAAQRKKTVKNLNIKPVGPYSPLYPPKCATGS